MEKNDTLAEPWKGFACEAHEIFQGTSLSNLQKQIGNVRRVSITTISVILLILRLIFILYGLLAVEETITKYRLRRYRIIRSRWPELEKSNGIQSSS